jgi:predicted ATPase
MIGRDEEVLKIQALLRTERLITIFGTGGIGKTMVALAVGHAVFAEFAETVYVIDLSTVSDREQVGGAVVSALGLSEHDVNAEDALCNGLGRRKGLIILDSCEHLIDETSALAGCILRRCPEMRILATSRETLQTKGERVVRLLPLPCPPEEPVLTATQVLAYPAAQLLLKRISDCGANLKPGDHEGAVVSEICRKLDGVPLAIELAAKRAAIFGLRDTATRLCSRFNFLTLGWRSDNLRHRTLRATLDWSHDHLSEVERLVLRRVAIFVGWFTLEAAIAIVAEAEIRQNDVADAMEGLVGKSVIEAEIERRETPYRLLDTTRCYALEKLLYSGEYHSVAYRHAMIKLQEETRLDVFDTQSSAPRQEVAIHAMARRDARKLLTNDGARSCRASSEVVHRWRESGGDSL